MVRGERDCGERKRDCGERWGGVYIHVLGSEGDCLHPCSWIGWTLMSLR